MQLSQRNSFFLLCLLFGLKNKPQKSSPQQINEGNNTRVFFVGNRCCCCFSVTQSQINWTDKTRNRLENGWRYETNGKFTIGRHHPRRKKKYLEEEIMLIFQDAAFLTNYGTETGPWTGSITFLNHFVHWVGFAP